MPKRLASTVVPSLGAFDRSDGNVGRQLAQRLRKAIVSGELKTGERLPSTRTMAASLGLARGTVVEVFDQLRAEGYLEARVGAGTRVATVTIENDAPQRAQAPGATEAIRLPISVARLSDMARKLAPTPPVPFSIAVPAAGIAPDDNWRRLGNRVRASARAQPTGYADPLGLQELRTAIAEHVRRARAVNCEPEQVIVTSGTQQGLYMAGRVLLDRSDLALAEDPAYPGLTAVLDDLGIRTERVPVDEHGITIDPLCRVHAAARAAFVTPSHQYPLGMPLAMRRRTALVDWAERNQAWIVEDDYDSELRYAGHPFPSMQGLNPARTVYLGTFSKVLFPSLRLGYVVAPSPLVEAFAGARAILDRHSPMADQHVLAAYIQGGFFEAHIRRIRGLYAERRSVLLAAIADEMPPDCPVEPSDQGMHILLWLPDYISDLETARSAQKAGLSVRPISPMYAANPRSGLMLGFGGFTSGQLRHATATLARIIRQLL